MRNDIKLTTVDASISDRSSGRRVNATIAFNISYDSPSPERAQKVVEDLVAVYLEENAKARAESISQTTAFLGQEAERVARQIQEIEANLAAFKKRNADRLPDSSAVTAQIAERIQSDIARLDRDLNSVQERRLYLEGQLAVVRPTVPPTVTTMGEPVLTPEDRLRVLEAQHASAIAMYHESHPDIRRMEREIAALKTIVADAKRTAVVPKPDNPAYIALASQLESTKREISQLSATRDDLRGKLKVQEAKLQQIPEVEREYRDLTRDYDNAQARYKDIKAKQMQAEIAQELEKDRKAERFTLGEPASYPERPIRPNRPAIALIGLVASVGGGVGVAWLRELIDPSIKGPLELARLAAVPVLTAIPYIETRRERSNRSRRGAVVAAALAVLAVLFFLAVHVFLKPLPDIWEGVLRRVLI
jgi:polysaccharide chain length determinant protein (PEP-CTERM system associated)